MWTTEPLTDGARCHRWLGGGPMLTWRGFAQGLAEDPSFRSAFVEVLRSGPHEAVYWETPAASTFTADRPFEMVVLPSSTLGMRAASPLAFEEHLGEGEPTVRTFTNLGGDTWLVAPTEVGERDAYGHLMAFLRRAPAEQIDALWQQVGEQVLRWWAERVQPLWLSTAGDGVAWLHVRLDERPKYYGHEPYRLAD